MVSNKQLWAAREADGIDKKKLAAVTAAGHQTHKLEHYSSYVDAQAAEAAEAEKTNAKSKASSDTSSLQGGLPSGSAK